MAGMDLYMSKTGVFKYADYKSSPAVLFVKGGSIDREFPEFAKQARRVAELPVGSSAVERGNSTLKLLDAPQRQRMNTETRAAQALVRLTAHAQLRRLTEEEDKLVVVMSEKRKRRATRCHRAGGPR